MIHRLVLLALGLALAACGSPPSAQESLPHDDTRDGVYHYDPIGWRFPLPLGWTVLPPDQVMASAQEGREMIGEVAGEIDSLPTRELLHLTHLGRNQFSSTVDRFDPAGGSYETQRQATFEVLPASFRAQGIPLRHSSSTDRIGGIDFDVLEMEILTAEGGQVMVRSSTYMALIGDQVLLVSLTTADEYARADLFEAWRASRFEPPGPP